MGGFHTSSQPPSLCHGGSLQQDAVQALRTAQWCSRPGCSRDVYFPKTSTRWGAGTLGSSRLREEIKSLVSHWYVARDKGVLGPGEVFKCSEKDVCAVTAAAQITFVLSTFRERLLPIRHTDRQLTTLLLALLAGFSFHVCIVGWASFATSNTVSPCEHRLRVFFRASL